MIPTINATNGMMYPFFFLFFFVFVHEAERQRSGFSPNLYSYNVDMLVMNLFEAHYGFIGYKSHSNRKN